VLRVANAYGPGQLTGRGQGVVGAFLDNIVRGKPVTIFGTGRCLRDYIQVDDVARAVVASLTAGGAHTVNIGTGIGTSLLQIVEELERIAGRRIEIDFQPLRGFDVESIVLDVAPFRALTGHEPIAIAEGLADAYEWTSARARRLLRSSSGTMS
jgi:UDP-glucose 4-epimerase